MSYKRVLKEKLYRTQKQSLEEIKYIIEDIYIKALKESKKTGQSTESITYEILEGIYEFLEDNNRYLLSSIIEYIIDITYQEAFECIKLQKRKIKEEKRRLKEISDCQKAKLKDSLNTFKLFIEDKNYQIPSKKLFKIQKQVDFFCKKLTPSQHKEVNGR